MHIHIVFCCVIVTLNDFFMIFVILSGFAALVLFLLSKVLLKMMHGIR